MIYHSHHSDNYLGYLILRDFENKKEKQKHLETQFSPHFQWSN